MLKFQTWETRSPIFKNQNKNSVPSPTVFSSTRQVRTCASMRAASSCQCVRVLWWETWWLTLPFAVSFFSPLSLSHSRSHNLKDDDGERKRRPSFSPNGHWRPAQKNRIFPAHLDGHRSSSRRITRHTSTRIRLRPCRTLSDEIYWRKATLSEEVGAERNHEPHTKNPNRKTRAGPATMSWVECASWMATTATGQDFGNLFLVWQFVGNRHAHHHRTGLPAQLSSGSRWCRWAWTKLFVKKLWIS